MSKKTDYNARSSGGWANWREHMYVTAKERQEKYEYVLCGSFDLSRIPTGESVIVGTFSCTWMHAKKRYLKRAYVLDIGLGLQTPAEIARDYLVAKFGRGAPVRKSKTPESADFKAMPGYAEPGRLRGDWVYVDVDAAYWSAMKVVGWNCLYNPGHYLARGGSVADFPLPDHKLARNMLVSCGLPGSLFIATERGAFSRKTYNQLLNGNLWRMISDVLHLFATYAIDECGARYFLTDGAIMPERFVEKYRAFAWSLGFGVSYKSDVGPGWIKAIGAYKLRGKQTKTFERYTPRPLFRVRAVDDLLPNTLRKLRDNSVWLSDNEQCVQNLTSVE